ncbi:MAG: DUF2974 domain-containing protein [Clostridiales bacterium]|nr:DUF2974 domain-containing protein [Candidatus Crickella equi]
MDRIQDYVRWRGDLGWDIVPITTEDIVVMCSLTYNPFEELKGDFKGKTLGELNNRIYVNGKLPRTAAGWQKKLFKMWKELPLYPRFADVKLADFLFVPSTDEDEQIAVATYELPGCAVVAFRGTDTTMADWKESLEIAHQGLLPARKSAVDYLNATLERYDRVYVCGHSKGGSLALYSSAHCNNQDKIVKIYNLDGPGLDKDSYDDNWTDIEERVHTIVPEGSTFGVIIGYGANYAVVSSTSKGFNQHDTFTWKFDGPHLNYVEKLSAKSRVVGKTFHKFMEESSEEDRRTLVDTVQRLADATEADDTTNIVAKIAASAPKVVREVKNMDESDKKTLKKLGKQFVSHGIETIKKDT